MPMDKFPMSYSLGMREILMEDKGQIYYMFKTSACSHSCRLILVVVERKSSLGVELSLLIALIWIPKCRNSI